MSIDALPENIYTTLSSHAGLLSLIGNSDSPITGRVYPVAVGYSVDLPYVTFNQVSEMPINVLDNTGGGGRRKVRIQIDSYSETHKEAFDVAEQVRIAMRDASLFNSTYKYSFDRYEYDTKLYSVTTEFLISTM